MATNPYFTPYKTQRFSFIGSPQQRSGGDTQDQRFVNLYPELISSDMTNGKKYYLKKRPGLQTITQLGTGSQPGRGCYYWEGHSYVAVGNTLYKDGVAIITFTTSTGLVGFTTYRDDTRYLLFVSDGVQGYTIDLGGAVIAIVALPTPHIPNPIFLDGYIFLAGQGGQTIYNSKLQDPYTWPSDGFIDAEMYPDNLVALTKNLNYIVAVGTASVEFLYDNANSTGSPLQRNAPAVNQFGCPAPNSVAQTEKCVILVGTTNNGGRTVFMLEAFQPTEIASEPIREALDLEGGYINTATAFIIQSSGHQWYVLTLTHSSRTFVYDFHEKMWHEWTSGNSAYTAFNWGYACDGPAGLPLLLSYSGQIAYLDANTYTDGGTTIYCQAVTTKIDFDTNERKRFYRLSLVGDAPLTSGTVPILVEWSDDDYNTWTGKNLTINQTYQTITQLGYGRRRAFRFTYLQNAPLRMESFELDIIQEQRR